MTRPGVAERGEQHPVPPIPSRRCPASVRDRFRGQECRCQHFLRRRPDAAVVQNAVRPCGAPMWVMARAFSRDEIDLAENAGPPRPCGATAFSQLKLVQKAVSSLPAI